MTTTNICIVPINKVMDVIIYKQDLTEEEQKLDDIRFQYERQERLNKIYSKRSIFKSLAKGRC